MTGPNVDRRVNLGARYAKEILLEVLPAAARDSPANALQVICLLGEVDRLIEASGDPDGRHARSAALLGNACV